MRAVSLCRIRSGSAAHRRRSCRRRPSAAARRRLRSSPIRIPIICQSSPSVSTTGRPSGLSRWRGASRGGLDLIRTIAQSAHRSCCPLWVIRTTTQESAITELLADPVDLLFRDFWISIRNASHPAQQSPHFGRRHDSHLRHGTDRSLSVRQPKRETPDRNDRGQRPNFWLLGDPAPLNEQRERSSLPAI